MGHWVIANGKISWVKTDVDLDEYEDTGARKWWSSWAPVLCGLGNVKLPVYEKAAWTKKELSDVVRDIRQEIEDHEEHWDVEVRSMGEGGLSTCQAKMGHGDRHQSLRKYNIIVNRSNPLNYQLGLSAEVLTEIGLMHEQTHALCDISYTSNNAASRLGTWNDDNGAYDEDSDGAADARDRVMTIVKAIDKDTHISDAFKKVVDDRIGYGWRNFIDIDTTTNELCLVASHRDESLLSPTIRALIDLANLNLGFRAIGRKMQLEIPRLRVY